MSRPLSTDEIWREFSGRLRGYIGAQVRRPEDAEDILQEVFIRIHEKLDTLRSTERLAPWLYALARNAVIDHLRRRRGTEPLADAPEPAAVGLAQTGRDPKPWVLDMAGCRVSAAGEKEKCR